MRKIKIAGENFNSTVSSVNNIEEIVSIDSNGAGLDEALIIEPMGAETKYGRVMSSHFEK